MRGRERELELGREKDRPTEGERYRQTDRQTESELVCVCVTVTAVSMRKISEEMRKGHRAIKGEKRWTGCGARDQPGCERNRQGRKGVEKKAREVSVRVCMCMYVCVKEGRGGRERACF